MGAGVGGVMQCLTIFVCQFAYVALLGLQSRNVQHANCAGAGIVSALLGIAGLTITTIIARTAIAEGGWPVWIAYVVAGPVGIVFAIRFDTWRRSR